MMSATMSWLPPGKDCGLCGVGSCKNFLAAVQKSQKEYGDCPFYAVRKTQVPSAIGLKEAIYREADILGNSYDFVLNPLPGEVSARKIVLPFRSELVEKLALRKGDLVLGRPMGAGCPVPHVLKIIKAEYNTGLLYTWVVGPKYSREEEVKDLTAYHMVGFEGVAGQIRKIPGFGRRVTFLPGFCMMNLNHTGLVNMVLNKHFGLQVRIEDIRILAG